MGGLGDGGEVGEGERMRVVKEKKKPLQKYTINSLYTHPNRHAPSAAH